MSTDKFRKKLAVSTHQTMQQLKLLPHQKPLANPWSMA